ncbi:MAG: hypothetical protein F4Y18_00820, partial [Cenarchaeum sp. SB0663_bin_5]|nr:hypothetical protein [Cenarchaeum sp. SB0663_bin_5]
MKDKDDFLVSEATYDLGRQLRYAMRHKITEQGVLDGHVVDKVTLASDIMKKKKYVTAFYTMNGWRRGKKIKAYRIDGKLFVRIDDNKVFYDNLGDLPEVRKVGFESSSIESSSMKSSNESPLSKLRKRQIENDRPAKDTKMLEALTYAEPPDISASDVLKDRRDLDLKHKHTSFSSQDDILKDLFDDISDADITTYSNIHGRLQIKNEEDARILADTIKRWVAQGRPLPTPPEPDTKDKPSSTPGLLPTSDPAVEA